MEKNEMIYLLDVIKVYITQSKEFRLKFVDLLKSVDEELDKNNESLNVGTLH